MIQDVTRTIRKIREFSESAKADIREELGPEFKDFDFEDLNPKTFIRKQLDNDDLGLKEIRNGFDLKKEMAEVADAVLLAEGPQADHEDARHDEQLHEPVLPLRRARQQPYRAATGLAPYAAASPAAAGGVRHL
jgi:hypothetical protein